MKLSETTVRSILTRTTGFLNGVTSHSAQPYRGCSYGRSLCGTGCYVQHNRWLTRGSAWGSFLELRTNAAAAYREQVARERRWARRARGDFGIFMSSSTDPFVPQERSAGISRSLLEAMLESPPDQLVLQTHSHRVTDYLALYLSLRSRCRLRIHISIESDRETLTGLPAPASSVGDRFEAARILHAEQLEVVVAVAPLLPIREPRAFLERIAEVSSAVVIDHFVGGDGTADGSRTARTRLPEAMAGYGTRTLQTSYRDEVVRLARQVMPGRVGVGAAGFAGQWM